MTVWISGNLCELIREGFRAQTILSGNLGHQTIDVLRQLVSASLVAGILGTQGGVHADWSAIPLDDDGFTRIDDGAGLILEFFDSHVTHRLPPCGEHVG